MNMLQMKTIKVSEYQLLQQGHDMAITIVGSLGLHHFMPLSTSSLKGKRFSGSD
jgi:hypothetical protein